MNTIELDSKRTDPEIFQELFCQKPGLEGLGDLWSDVPGSENGKWYWFGGVLVYILVHPLKLWTPPGPHAFMHPLPGRLQICGGAREMGNLSVYIWLGWGIFFVSVYIVGWDEDYIYIFFFLTQEMVFQHLRLRENISKRGRWGTWWKEHTCQSNQSNEANEDL